MSFMQAGQIMGVFIIAFGLLNIFARSFFWKTEQFSDHLRGKRAERTSLWDMWQILKGVLMIALGLALLSQGQW